MQLSSHTRMRTQGTFLSEYDRHGPRGVCLCSITHGTRKAEPRPISHLRPLTQNLRAAVLEPTHLSEVGHHNTPLLLVFLAPLDAFSFVEVQFH